MHRLLTRFSILMILSIWGLMSGCVTPAESSNKGDQIRQSFLWEAKKGDETLTLVGTMHIGITPDDMDPKLWQRLTAADTVIIETDVTAYSPDLVKRYLVMPSGQTLDKMLSAKHWRRMNEILSAAGSHVSEAQLRHVTPMAAGAMLLQVQAKDEQQMKAGQHSIDQVIYERAKAQGKRTQTFETNQEQMGYLEAVFTVAAVEAMLDEWEAEGENYRTMKNVFKSGDSERLSAMLEEIPVEMRGILLDKRNENWIKALPNLKGPRHTLIAVGAAHFAGDRGLLKLLEAQGFSIKPL